jgi:hypothetical protein
MQQNHAAKVRFFSQLASLEKPTASSKFRRHIRISSLPPPGTKFTRKCPRDGSRSGIYLLRAFGHNGKRQDMQAGGRVTLHFVPGHIIPGHFVPGHFVPWSLCSRSILSSVTLSPVSLSSGHFFSPVTMSPVTLSPVILSPVNLSPLSIFVIKKMC